MSSNERSQPDDILVDIADYVADYRISKPGAIEAARLCMMDAIACALDALDYPDCTKLLGPVVPGTVVPHGSRVPGTAYELDPVTATFGFGCMIRWLDFNDTFTAAQGSHPTDNLAGILMLADHLSRRSAAAGRKPLVVRDVLESLIKAYEIQGCIAIENDFKEMGINAVALNWRSIIGPRGLSEEQLRYWDDVFGKLAALPEWRQDLEARLVEHTYFNSRDTRVLMEREYGALAATLADLGLAK